MGVSDVNQIVSRSGGRILGVPVEPDWNKLITLGVPLSSKTVTAKLKEFNAPFFFEQINVAFEFLSNHAESVEYQRHRDALKGFVLALKTHYPGILQQISHPLARSLAQESVRGRDIKLRNIALERMAHYL